ncbi:hypothetical protein ANN_24646 [Periplaneta americana]|uniref:Uncharacterized protein n=1 Tax=Periplaneta americana TaxID=6978 RepID=A0ABQ8S3Y2_PERAM|nr:hypothetical protein ANN_24646 [Periplaneta americana]
MVVVITEDVQNVHLLLEYRPHIDVSLTCEHDPELQEYCVCLQNMPQFDSEGIPNQAPEKNKPMILNGPTSRNREDSDQVSVEAKQLGHLYLSIDQETFDPNVAEKDRIPKFYWSTCLEKKRFGKTEIMVERPDVVVITEDVQNVHLLLEYRPHIDVSLICKHDPKLQEYCVCPQNMPQFNSEGIPNQALETNKPMILNGPTSRNREGSDQVSVEAKQLGHLYLSIDQETFDPSTGEPKFVYACPALPRSLNPGPTSYITNRAGESLRYTALPPATNGYIPRDQTSVVTRNRLYMEQTQNMKRKRRS